MEDHRFLLMTGKGRKEEHKNMAGTDRGWLDNSLFISVCVTAGDAACFTRLAWNC